MNGPVVTAPFESDAQAGLWDVVDVLSDPACRRLLGALEDPETAQELAKSVGIPVTTTYRKLDALEEVGLVERRTAIRVDGRNETRFQAVVGEVELRLDDGRTFESRIGGNDEEQDQTGRDRTQN